MQTKKSNAQYKVVLGLGVILVTGACAGQRYPSPQADARADSLLLLARRDSLLQDSLLATQDSVATPVDSLHHSSDTVTRSTPPDSLPSLDSLSASRPSDSLQTSPQTLAASHDSLIDGFDDIIAYKAKDSMVLIGTSLGYLFGPSTVDYKDKGMDANFMRLNLDSNLVYSHYILDSTGRATAYPKFRDGDQSYEAKSMNYNFKTAKGFITGAVTQQGEGYVTAERTKKDDQNNLYMEDGRYTTCDDHDHPHFYLQLTKAKVRPGKNIVAGPSYLVVAGLPLPIGLPFGFFPFTSSYSSGIIMPSYGDENNRGLYLREGGYYWAINDYMDLKLTGEIYSLGSWGVNASSNYRKRYRYSGNFNLNYLVTKQGDKDVAGSYSKSTDFRINWTHSQDPKANPSQTFSASVNYSTSSYNHNSLSTLYNPLVSGQNTKSSSINYSKTFTGTPWSLSASIDATQTSRDSMVTLSLPNLSVSMSRIYPFKRKKRVGAERWYEKISISYSGQLRNSITTKENELFKQNLLRDWRNGINHSIPISASYKLLDYIDLTVSANYNERWYSYKTERRYDADADKVVQDTIRGFNRAYDFSTSLNLNSTLYGFYKPWKLFGDKVQMIRHRMTPSIGISYRPDFGTNSWGYYRDLDYTDKQGRYQHQRYSIYEGQLFGGPSMGKTAALNFSIDNNLEAKIRSKKDTINGFKKISLIDNFNISTSYNLAADSFRLSDINTSLTLKWIKGVNLSFSGSWDPYTYTHTTDQAGNVTPIRLDKLRILHGKGLGGLRSTGTSFSYTFNNDTFGKILSLLGLKDKDKAQGKDNKDQGSQDGNNPNGPDTSLGALAAQKQDAGGSLYERGREDEGEYDAQGYLKYRIPWSFSINYGVTYGRADFNPTKDDFNYQLTHSLMFSGNIQPTKNWSFNFNASYDFQRKEISNMTIGISRDLHCWAITASAIPVGYYKSYSLTLAVKSSLLSDLKYDKRSYPSNTTWY